MKNEKKENKKAFNNWKKVLKKIKIIFNNIGKEFKIFWNVNVGKLKGKHIVLGIVVVLFLLLIVRIVGNSSSVNYPVIYNNSDADLYLIGSDMSSEDAIKLATGESINNVLYANTTDRYVLFQKSEDLYLYDSKSDGSTTKIIDNIISYDFNDNDEYIVALDEEADLIVYNYKDAEVIDSDVIDIIDISEDYVMYEKDNGLYVRSINPKKDDRDKVVENYGSYVYFSEDGSNITYLTNDQELYIYNIKSGESDKVSDHVSSYYCDNDACKKLFYVYNDGTRDLYYWDSKDSVKVASEIVKVEARNVEEKQVVYSTVSDGEYSLYYQKVGSDAEKIEDGLSSIRSVKIFKDDSIYYITGSNEVRYVDIKGSSIGDVKSIASGVIGYLYLYKNGYAFVSDVDENSNGTLYMVKKGNAKEIDTNVNSSLLTVSNDGKKIYYMKDYETSGDLYVTSGSSGKKIDSDVYIFEYIKDDLIYYIKDYNTSKSRGELYRYTNKSVLLDSDVIRIAGSPVYYDGN